VINKYALGRIVAQFKSAFGFISARKSHQWAAIHVSFSPDFKGLQDRPTQQPKAERRSRAAQL
jgi:hypothetical protein